MEVWRNFAFISDDTVKNVACYLYTGYTEANQHAKLFTNNMQAFAVDVTHIPVQNGDKYIDNTFYRDGVAVLPLPSASDQITEMSNTIDELIIAITPIGE